MVMADTPPGRHVSALSARIVRPYLGVAITTEHTECAEPKDWDFLGVLGGFGR
jgi:hypothetical protein